MKPYAKLMILLLFLDPSSWNAHPCLWWLILCQLDGAKILRELVKYSYGCVCEGVLGRNWHLNWWTEKSRWPFPAWVDIIESIEGLNRKKIGGGWTCFLCLSWDIHLLLPLDSVKNYTIASLSPPPSLPPFQTLDSDWMTSQAHLASQLTDCKL